MRYDHNYLSHVILRLDFPELPALKTEQQPLFTGAIAERYSFVAAAQVTAFNFTVNVAVSGVEKQIRGWKWDYKSVEDDNHQFSISHDFFALEYSNKSFEDSTHLLADFAYLYDHLSQHYAIAQFNRIGLRYINEIDDLQGNPLEWNNFITDALSASCLAGLGVNNELLRSMHQLIVKRDEMNLTFNYGILNPDFPNAVARKIFVLDYDCVIAGVIEPRDIDADIRDMNSLCEEMFERSIEPGLREHMGEIDD